MGPCDFRLIELIRQNKHLYDHSHPDFMNLEKKEITWRAIAAAQGSTPEICRRRFRSLRDRFVREKKQNAQQLLDGTASNPIWLKMMFLWDHLRPYKRFQWNRPKPNNRLKNANNGTLSLQNVYTVVPVDSSGVPIPNHPVASASYILVNATSENSPEVMDLNSAATEMQSPSQSADNVSIETYAQESTEVTEVQSDLEEQESQEPIAEEMEDVRRRVSSKSVTEDFEEGVPTDAVAAVPSDAEQVSPEGLAKVSSDGMELLPSNDTELECPDMVIKSFQKMPKFSKRGLEFRGKKRLKHNTTRKLSKKTKSAEVRSAENLGHSQNINTVTNSSCNAAFCTVVKNYLDKISNPMRLSSTRIKLLSLVHDEMYSTN